MLCALKSDFNVVFRRSVTLERVRHTRANPRPYSKNEHRAIQIKRRSSLTPKVDRRNFVREGSVPSVAGEFPVSRVVLQAHLNTADLGVTRAGVRIPDDRKLVGERLNGCKICPILFLNFCWCECSLRREVTKKSNHLIARLGRILWW